MSSCEEMNEAMVEEYVSSRIPPRPVKALIIMLACFSALGLLGNSLVLYVYIRKRNKLSSTVFIIALAGIDLVTSAVGMPYTMVVEGLDYQIPADFLCKLYYFIITCTVPFSVFIMVAIAIDRYICICRPHSHVLDAIRARNSIFALLVIAVVIGLITAMFYGVYLDVGAFRSSEVTPDQMHVAVANNINNVSRYLSLLEQDGGNAGSSNSTNVADFTDRLMGMIVDLYKTVCGKEHPLNQSYIYTGHCLLNQITFSYHFRRTYQTIYSSSFLVCFAVVFVLYIMIYRSVLVRRSRRFAARTKTTLNQEVSLTENQTMLNESPDKTIAMADIHNGTKEKRHLGSSIKQQHLKQQSEHLLQNQHSKQQDEQPQQQQQQQPGSQRCENQNNSCVRDKYLMANIRTAIMLFVVTLAFVISYLPSWLMAFKVIRFNVMIFYVYFSNHIVNPIIYAFMNPAFRRSLKGLLCRKKTRSI